MAAIAFAAPLVLGLAPGLRLPAVVLEILAGIVVGPSVLDWVEVDEPLEVMSLVGWPSCSSSPASRSTWIASEAACSG